MAFRAKACFRDINEGYKYTLCMLKPACRAELSHQTCTWQKFPLQPSAYSCAFGIREHASTHYITYQAFHSLADV